MMLKHLVLTLIRMDKMANWLMTADSISREQRLYAQKCRDEMELAADDLLSLNEILKRRKKCLHGECRR
jgi:hypothetical protein